MQRAPISEDITRGNSVVGYRKRMADMFEPIGIVPCVDSEGAIGEVGYRDRIDEDAVKHEGRDDGHTLPFKTEPREVLPARVQKCPERQQCRYRQKSPSREAPSR